MSSEVQERHEQDKSSVGGLLQTVGGSAAGIIYAIRTLCPRAVVFLCSEDSIATAVEVKKAVQGDGKTTQFHTIRIDNPADLVACHRAAAAGIAILRETFKLSRDEIRIDFTGGTKAMSAAAVLAAAPDGYQFAYVSGERRDKGGLGTVLDGAESLCLPENPWVVLEEPETRRMIDMAAQGQWTAALDSARRMLDRATDQSRPIFQLLCRILEGLGHWDRFAHKEAFEAWKRGDERDAAPGRLVELATVGQRPLLVRFAEKCRAMFAQLGPLANPGRQLAEPDRLVLDMLANGERQAARGDFDAAALRYYRAVELWADRRLQFCHRIDNSAVKDTDVPEPLRDEWLQSKGPPAPVWKLGLHDSVALLAAKDDPAAQPMLEQLLANKLDTGARNQSWLIHGSQHVEQGQFLAFRASVLAALALTEAQIPQWPDFRDGAGTPCWTEA